MTSPHSEYNLDDDNYYTDAVPLLIHESSELVEKSNENVRKLPCNSDHFELNFAADLK